MQYRNTEMQKRQKCRNAKKAENVRSISKFMQKKGRNAKKKQKCKKKAEMQKKGHKIHAKNVLYTQLQVVHICIILTDFIMSAEFIL